jgi:hypothetical protein
MCDVVTAKFGVGGGVADLQQGLTHIRRRLAEPVTPIGGGADLERLRDPDDPEFDDLKLRDAAAEAPSSPEDAQLCVSLLTGLLGLSATELDRLTLTLLAVHPLAVQWLVKFPLPIMRDFAGHLIDAGELGPYKLTRSFEQHEEACAGHSIARGSPQAWALIDEALFDPELGACKTPMPLHVVWYNNEVINALTW